MGAMDRTSPWKGHVAIPHACYSYRCLQAVQTTYVLVCHYCQPIHYTMSSEFKLIGGLIEDNTTLLRLS